MCFERKRSWRVFENLLRITSIQGFHLVISSNNLLRHFLSLEYDLLTAMYPPICTVRAFFKNLYISTNPFKLVVQPHSLSSVIGCFTEIEIL